MSGQNSEDILQEVPGKNSGGVGKRKQQTEK